MPETPPPELIALLERLGLAAAADVRGVGRRVRRLARDLPQFESVWVDALAQARVLTPFQAAEINAGRGESLRVGPYLVCAPARWPGYVACYRARRADSGGQVRLAVVERAGRRAEEIVGRLEGLAAASQALQGEQVAPWLEVGAEGDRIWAASAWVEGRTAAEWMAHHGRFPPEVVLAMARAMLASLVRLEEAGLCHGDVGTAAVTLTGAGGVVLLQPGLRAIVRPEEGYAHADLLPEAYDYLAPERITEGTPPTIAGDVYACGCLWWQMLCGRPPFSGGDSLGKLRAAQAARIPDLRELAPEVPGPLGAAIPECLKREPGERPESMARLAEMLGPPTRVDRLAVARCLARPGRPAERWTSPGRTTRQSAGAWGWAAATAGCLVAAAALWGVWQTGLLGCGGDRELSETPRADAADREVGVPSTRETSEGPHSPGRGRRGAGSDNPVVAAHYQAERSPSETPPRLPEDLVLASGGPLTIESLRLRAGQCVRGPRGERPLIVVPRTGLVVAEADVRFENVNFVWDHPPEADDTASRQPAVVDLRSARAEFRGCRFESVRGVAASPAAVRWTHPDDPGGSALALPSGRVRLSDCVLRGVDAGVDCRTLGAVAVEVTNTLHLGTGPLVRLDHCPRPDEPVVISASQVTLRGGGPLLECRYREMEGQPGEISIEATGSAFVPGGGAPLMLLRGPQSPGGMLRGIRWTGQGSLVSPEAAIALWRRPDGGEEVLDEAAVSIDGLVRSEVGFAGRAEAGPAASRIIRWRAPLRSADPPGIDPARLPRGDARVGGAGSP